MLEFPNPVFLQHTSTVLRPQNLDPSLDTYSFKRKVFCNPPFEAASAQARTQALVFSKAASILMSPTPSASVCLLGPTYLLSCLPRNPASKGGQEKERKLYQLYV